MQSFLWMLGPCLRKMKKGNSISNFLTEKRFGTIKARQCADRRKQWYYMAIEEVTHQLLQLMKFLLCLWLIQKKVDK